MAITYVGLGPNTSQTNGSSAASTVAVTPTMPAGLASGHRVFVFQSASNTAGTTPANWTEVYKNRQVGSSSAPGAGSGRRYSSCYYRDYDGVWTMPSFPLTSAAENSHALCSMAVAHGAGESFARPTYSSQGYDGASSNTSHSATTYYRFTTLANSILMAHTSLNDSVSMSGAALSGGTFTGLSEEADRGETTGNDVRIITHVASVTADGYSQVTLTGTLSASSSGGTLFVQQATTNLVPLESITDPFTSLDTAKWSADPEVTISNGQLVIAPSTDSRIRVIGAKDMVGSGHSVELITPPSATGGVVDFQFGAYMENSDDEDGWDFLYERDVAGGTQLLYMREWVSGSASTTNVTYSGTDHRWLRVREFGGTIFWDTSQDGISWTNRRNKSNATGLTPRQMQASLTTFHSSGTGMGNAVLDNYNTVPTASGSYSDTFNRANSATSLGDQWLPRAGTMGISSNEAYPAVVTGGVYPMWTYVLPMLGNDMQVAYTTGSTVGSPTTAQDEVFLFLGANAAGTQYAAVLGENDGSWDFYAADGTGWGFETLQTGFANGTLTWVTGDVITLRRISNVYTVLKNGTPTSVTWTDSSGVVPRDADHRLVGVSGANASSGTIYRRVNAWSADAPTVAAGSGSAFFQFI